MDPPGLHPMEYISAEQTSGTQSVDSAKKEETKKEMEKPPIGISITFVQAVSIMYLPLICLVIYRYISIKYR